MLSTTQCPHCGVVLNLPEGAAGRRLRCPKCATKFWSDQPGARPPSSAQGVADAGAASSFISPTSAADGIVPLAEGDLRETFDLPMMTEADPLPAPRSKEAADAVALFKDDQEVPARHRSGAEARARTRVCPTCGGVVAPGMSLCSFCGLDLDTGMRVGIEEEFDDTLPETASGPSMPVSIGAIGGVAFLGSLLLAVIALKLYFMDEREGFEMLALVCVFAMFAAVQLLRGKSAKLLIVALTLGAVIDVVGLIALPVYRANEEIVVQQPVVTDPLEAAPSEEAMDGPQIVPYVDRLDFNSITWGIAILLIYAVIVVYLMSPMVQVYFEREQPAGIAPIRP
jgi:hypothetical protein